MSSVEDLVFFIIVVCVYVISKVMESMVHSSITDHIDREGVKCCNSNLTYPMLMKLSGQTNSLLSCVVL